MGINITRGLVITFCTEYDITEQEIKTETLQIDQVLLRFPSNTLRMTDNIFL